MKSNPPVRQKLLEYLIRLASFHRYSRSVLLAMVPLMMDYLLFLLFATALFFLHPLNADTIYPPAATTATAASVSTLWTNNGSLPNLSIIPRPTAVANVSTLWTNNNSLPSADRVIFFRYVDRTQILSPAFACGFYCISSPCDSFLFSVFIAYEDQYNSSSQLLSPRVIWSANRDRPVKENATVHFTPAGDLILRDADGTQVWSTNITSSGKHSVVASMNLTDTGNLVLLDRNNAPVWASFDHPTDTWVLGQTLRPGMRLTANVSATSSSRGQLYLTVVSGGLEAYVDSNPPQLYYSNVMDVDLAAIKFTNGSLISSTYSFVYLTPGSSVQYMTLESDGHLRHYEWGPNREGWKFLEDVLREPYNPSDALDYCAYPTVCGEYGICSSGQCSCPDSVYFSPDSERQPSLGCSPVTPLSCFSAQYQLLLPLQGVSYFNSIDSATISKYKEEEHCKQACLRNCSCKAALFIFYQNISDGSCYLPSHLFSLMSNNPTQSSYNSSVYIKIQNSTAPMASNTDLQKKTTSLAVKLGVIFGVLSAASLVVGFVFVLLRQKKVSEADEDDCFDLVAGLPTRFSYEELEVATEKFNEKLGEGGFGSVFGGTLGGERVAVKRLDGVSQGKKEFLAEVETIGKIHHINLVRLIGFCAEKFHRLLVYEYMCNSSLDKWIFYRNQDDVAFDWQTRRKIITDIAKGLSYLHDDCRQRIAHLDIKPQNILLDDMFNAKVSDFGLSKLIDRDKSHVMTRMRGTPGYLAPEWLTSKITEKADVYSFAVVILEIICGRKNLDYSQPEEYFHLIRLLQDKVEGNQLLDIVDKHNSDMQIYETEVVEMMKLAMWCLQSDSNKRPSMSVVVKVLDGSANIESNLDYNFTSLAPPVSHDIINSSPSALQLASLLSGPR